jgi:hypothetical protein
MHKCIPIFYMPISDSTQLRFTLKKRYSLSQARLIGPFSSLAFVMMKASSGCSLRADTGHLDSMQPSWPHPRTLYCSPQICPISSPPLLHSVKLEMPDNLVNLSSDSSEDALPSIPPPTPAAHTPISNSKCNKHSKSVFTPIGLSGHSNLSRPPFHPNTREYLSVMQCLRHLASFPGSKNELTTLDYNKIPYHKVQYLPPSYDGDVIFELPPSCISASTSKNTMDGMDKQFDGHTWCRTITSNIHNSQGLTFRKSLCIGQLVCNNKSCDFFTRSSKHNENEWSGRTNTPFKLGHLPPPNSTLVCKVYKVVPICVTFCP